MSGVDVLAIMAGAAGCVVLGAGLAFWILDRLTTGPGGDP